MKRPATPTPDARGGGARDGRRAGQEDATTTRIRSRALDEALARAADGVFAVTPDGRIVLWNRTAERILGYSAHEAVGRPCCELLAGRDDTGNRLCYRGCHVMTMVAMGEAVQTFDLLTQTKGGRPVWLSISTLVVPAGRRGGNVTVHLFRDVTATKDLLALLHARLGAPAPRDDAADAEADGAAAALTRREVEVLRLMSSGAGTKALAAKLHVSPATVRNHVQNLFGKLGVHSRLEAVACATRQGLL